jgi:AraC family transcriptional regulator
MRHHRDRLVPVLREINAHPEQPLAVAAMAARTGYGPDHFARVFREVTGWAPKDYILHARIQRAAALLRESSHTVSQIATLLGYQDISFFSRQFRDRMGVSPGRFRLRRAKE